MAGARMEADSESSPAGHTRPLSLTWFLVQTSIEAICFDCVTLAFKHGRSFTGLQR